MSRDGLGDAAAPATSRGLSPGHVLPAAARSCPAGIALVGSRSRGTISPTGGRSSRSRATRSKAIRSATRTFVRCTSGRPASYDDEAERRYPSVYVIQGMTGIARAGSTCGRSSARTRSSSRSCSPEAIVVLVDAFTASAARSSSTRPRSAATTRTSATRSCRGSMRGSARSPSAEHRGIQGKSSGGYGAMITPMLRPDLFGALATHAGDALFEVCYALEFAPAARALAIDTTRRSSGSGTTSARPPVLVGQGRPDPREHYAMAAAYSATRRRDGRAPVRHRDRRAEAGRVRSGGSSGTRCDARAGRGRRGAPRQCAGSGSTAGSSDEYYLDLGATAFRRVLDEIGVAGRGGSVRALRRPPRRHTWRYPLSLAWLVERLAP